MSDSLLTEYLQLHDTFERACFMAVEAAKSDDEKQFWQDQVQQLRRLKKRHNMLNEEEHF